MNTPKEITEYRELKNKISSILRVRDVHTGDNIEDIQTLSSSDLFRSKELALIIKDKYLEHLSHAEKHELQFDIN